MREETKKMSYHLSVNWRSALLPLRHFLWLLLWKAPPSGVYPFRKAFLTWYLLWCHTCILKWKNTFLKALRTLQLNGEDREMIKVAVIQKLNVFGNYLVEGGKATYEFQNTVLTDLNHSVYVCSVFVLVLHATIIRSYSRPQLYLDEDMLGWQ